MKRPRSHEIDELAMRVFRDALPPSWVVNEQTCDYAKDYLVEIVEAGSLTGISFYVQLKGQESLTISRDGKHATFWLRRKYAVYYADQVRLPVFLVLVDVNKELGYWLFVQPYLLDDLRGKKWRKQASVGVKVPTRNGLTDTNSFRKAVDGAIEYMAALYPTSIKKSIRAQQLRLESLDPRFGIQIDVIQGQEMITALAKEQVEGTITFKGEPEAVALKLESLFGRGLPTSFGPDEIEVTGSLLFAEAFKAGGILGVSQILEGTVSLLAQDNSAHVLSTLENIPGTLTGGRNECRFEGQLADSPLKLHITVSREGKSASIRFCFDVSRWHGQPIRFLPYFDQIAAFFEGVKDCTVLDLKCFLRGNEFFGGRIHQEDLSIFKKVAGFLPLLTKAREICRIAGLNPILNENIDREKARDILQLHKLLTEGEFRQKVRDAEISVTAPRSQIEKLITGPRMVDIPLVLASGEDQKVLLFGQQVVVGKLEYHFSHAKLVPTKKDLQERLAASRAKRIEVAFASMEHSELVIRRVNQ